AGGVDAQIHVAVNGAAVAAVHLDGVLFGRIAEVAGGFHAAVTHRVQLPGLWFAGLYGMPFGIGPIQSFARSPTGAFVVVLGPFLLGGGHGPVVVGAHHFAEHVIGKVG